MTKKALLDTDFLFKTHLSQNSRKESLADVVMSFEGYEFFCHEKILDELKIHGPDSMAGGQNLQQQNHTGIPTKGSWMSLSRCLVQERRACISTC